MNEKKTNSSFQRFLIEADARLKHGTGISVRELPNFDWRAAHRNGQKPAQAAQNAMLGDKK
jgi:hypothetical protein